MTVTQRQRGGATPPTAAAASAPPAGALAALGSWAARHRRLVVVGWLIALAAAAIGHAQVNSSYSDTLSIPGSAAQQGLNLLAAHDARAGGQGGQLVFVASGSPLASQRTAVERARDNLARLPHVLAVSNPLTPQSVAKDGRTAYASVNFNVNPQSLGQSYIESVNRATAVARDAGVQVYYGGALGQAARPRTRDSKSELIGIVVALIVLLAGFGSVLAASLPLLSAILAVFTGISLLGMLAAAVSFGTSAPTLATMMGLGVGIDYALFLTTRYRQRLLETGDPDRAIAATMTSSGRAVLIAAVTVVIAMLGLYASGITFIGKLGLAAAITVAVAALASLTLVPALLGFARGRIDAVAVRRPVAEPGDENSALHRYARAVERHPWRFALGGIAVLAVIAIPAFSMSLGHVTAGSEPTSWSERQAYDAVTEAFGAGANGPFTIVVQLGARADVPALERSLSAELGSTADVADLLPLRQSADGELLVGRVIPASAPGSTATAALAQRLQTQILPSVLRGTGARGYVTGTTAAELEFQSTVASRLPLIIALVIAAAFLLLLATFRSPVLALKAAALNLLSIGAAYGILVAVFQWGWGVGILGLPGKVPIESYVPMMLFTIVFGLSMDYEVFLLSRVREHWLATHDNAASVAAGLAQTARVISCAAAIMTSVFLAFLLSTNPVVKMLALGLGASVIIDATVIRLVIVPALMFLFDRANWWTPRWLERVLPNI